MEISDRSFDEGYWHALLADMEAAGTEPARLDGNGQGDPAELEPMRSQRPVDVLWAAAQTACDADESLEIQVIGYNRGGLLIDWRGLRGFVPASHLVGFPAMADEDQRRSEFSKRVGTMSCAKVIELDRKRGRFVLSERLAYSDERRVDRLMSEMQPGQTRCGVVTTVCDFGAFVDLGGIEGLAHISEISWGRINHPADIVRCGQSINVYVMNVDREQKRVALSIKRMQPDPWASVADRYQIDQIVEGVVTTVVDFGAFVRLEDGIEGLIHISELAEGNFLHPRNVVQEGEVVKVRILNIDAEHRRVGLSLRQVEAA